MALTVTASCNGDLPGIMLSVKVLNGARVAVSQTGNTATAQTSTENSLTTTVADSVVYGALNDGNNDVFTADANTTFITYFNNSDTGDAFATFRGTNATVTPGAALYGADPANVSFPQAYAAAEILPSTTLTEDSSTPVTATSSTGSSVTTASFSPPVGSLLVALAAGGGDAAGLTFTVTDNLGLTWHQLAYATGNDYLGAGVWVADMPSGMAVTGTFVTNEYNDGCYLDVHVLTGAKAVAGQTGAVYEAPSTQDAQSATITTTKTGSQVFGVHYDQDNGNAPAHPLGGTTVLAYELPPEGVTYASYSALTATPGSTSVGYTDASGNGSTCLAEILPKSTIVIDASGPSPSWADDPSWTGGSARSARFTPVAGSLLVALITADSDGSRTPDCFTITDTAGLTWIQLAFSDAGGAGGCTSIFIADVAGPQPATTFSCSVLSKATTSRSLIVVNTNKYVISKIYAYFFFGRVYPVHGDP